MFGSMLKVLVVSANQMRLPDPVPPIGAMYVAAAARQAGHEVRMFDACFAGERADGELAADVARFDPDVVGLSIRNVDDTAYPDAVSYLSDYRNIVATVRRCAPGAVLVVGGAAFTLFADEFMAELGADYGVAGEGEKLFVELLARIECARGEGGERPEPRLLYAGASIEPSANVQPAWDLVDLPRYYREGGSANVQTKRGCAFACSYCTYPVLEGSLVRRRDATDVVAEIEELRSRFEIRHFFFVDNTFNHPPDHARSVCEEILRRGLKIRFTAYLTPASLSRELLALMARSGCTSADFGTDSASDRVLASLRKSFRVEQILAASAWCAEAGIKFNHSLLFGGPGETWETVRETVDNVVRTRPTSVIAILGVRLHRHTAVAEFAVAEGLVRSDQIGIAPLFYVAEAVKDGLPQYLAQVAAAHGNWIVPGLKCNLDARVFERARARGIKGPLWELLPRAAG